MALPIFPGRLQPSIVGRSELNFRVRDGNGWTLALISTNCCIATVLYSNKPLSNCQVVPSGTFKRFAQQNLAAGRIHFAREFLSSRVPEKALLFWDGDPYRIRTDVNGVRGRCLNHLTNGPCLRRGFPLDGAPIQWDGTPSGTRTPDTLIKSQVLYQLS